MQTKNDTSKPETEIKQESCGGSISTHLFGVGWVLAETIVAYAAISGIKGAENLITLIAITGALLGFLGLIALATTKEFTKKRPRWTMWIANACDLAIVVMLAWTGWMWIAGAWAWGFLISWLIRDKTVLLPNAGGMARELAAQDSDNSNDING